MGVPHCSQCDWRSCSWNTVFLGTGINGVDSDATEMDEMDYVGGLGDLHCMSWVQNFLRAGEKLHATNT